MVVVIELPTPVWLVPLSLGSEGSEPEFFGYGLAGIGACFGGFGHCSFGGTSQVLESMYPWSFWGQSKIYNVFEY